MESVLTCWLIINACATLVSKVNKICTLSSFVRYKGMPLKISSVCVGFVLICVFVGVSIP